MIKLIVFDLDGVLVETKNMHFEALNEALGVEYAISWSEHLSKYDGLKTNQKLEKLTKEKGLPIEMHEEIWNKKQHFTAYLSMEIMPSEELMFLMIDLAKDGYKLACCSNSITKTVNTILCSLGIIGFFDLILSNEDVDNSKPHPEMYWNAMSRFNVTPEETLIVEDSPYGLLAASRTTAHVMRVTSPKEVTYDNIKKYLNEQKMITIPKWKDKKLNVLIPMAGAGSRFAKAGYTFPKPIIEVNGKPMIQVVVENLNIDANYIYIVQKEHRDKYNLDALLHLLTPNCSVIEVNGMTEGAACTTLTAKLLINNDSPLLFANSDQFVEWNSNEFMYKMSESNCDGGILTFKATHPKWSFAKVDENGLVTEVAEKNPISDNATVGFYYWKHGSDFVKYAEQMISKNIRVNNEFYVCPVYNEAIQDGKQIRIFNIEKNWGLGTPEDLEIYLKHH